MTARNIIALVLAVVVGIIAIKVIAWVIGGLLYWIITGAVIAGIAYVLYRVFNKMLTSGKRLT